MRMEDSVTGRKRKEKSPKSTHRVDAGVAKEPARKKPTDLTLDPEAVARGEEYGRLHGASLSQLVPDLLYALPEPAENLQVRELSPAVRRLYGVAATRKAVDARGEYRAHLDRKYGGRKT